MATISNSNVFCRPRANSRWDVVRLFIVFILVLSSVAKAWELVTVSNLGRGLLNDRNFILLVVIFQLTFSCWLLCNFQPRIEWLSSLALFLFFLGVVCFKIITHEKDCQCFGAIQVHPWVTFCLDVTIVLALCFSKPTHRTGKRVKFKRYAYVFLVWLLALVIIISGFFSVNRTFSSVGDLYTGIDGEQSILIKPENWDRDDLPIVPFLETPEVWNRLEPGNGSFFSFEMIAQSVKISLPSWNQVMKNVFSVLKCHHRQAELRFLKVLFMHGCHPNGNGRWRLRRFLSMKRRNHRP